MEFGNTTISIKNPDGTLKEIGTLKSITSKQIQPLLTSSHTRPTYTIPSADTSILAGKTQSMSISGIHSGTAPDTTRTTSTVTGSRNRFKIDADLKKVNPSSVIVIANEVLLHRSEYDIAMNGTFTLKNDYPIGTSVSVWFSSDNEEYVIIENVLILATSKHMPFHLLKDFVPNLFDELSIQRLMKYPDNKRHQDFFDDSPYDKVYVLDYEIKKRGIYAKVKIYQDMF